MTERDYLLGMGAEGERRALEETYLGGDDAFERIQVVEQELIDSYARGELAPDERPPFEALFLADAERRRRVATSRALLASAPARPRWAVASLLAAAGRLALLTPRAREVTVRLPAPTRGAQELAIPAGADVVHLELELPPGLALEGVGARLRRVGGPWIAGRFDGAFVADGEDLRPGVYQLELVRPLPDGRETPLVYYRFRVVAR